MIDPSIAAAILSTVGAWARVVTKRLRWIVSSTRWTRAGIA